MAEPKFLAIYLNDHYAGAGMGRALAKRALKNNRGTELGVFLDQLVTEIEEDSRALEGIMRRLGVSKSPFKRPAAIAAERVGRLKLNGRVARYSPLSRVLELEGLTMGVDAKLSLWRNLRETAVAARLDDAELDRLIERAERQRRELEAHRATAARIAFGAV